MAMDIYLFMQGRPPHVASTVGDALDGKQKLSRHRRWIYPSDSGWSITFKGTLAMPIEDTSSSLGMAIPFTYSFDSGL